MALREIANFPIPASDVEQWRSRVQDQKYLEQCGATHGRVIEEYAYKAPSDRITFYRVILEKRVGVAVLQNDEEDIIVLEISDDMDDGLQCVALQLPDRQPFYVWVDPKICARFEAGELAPLDFYQEVLKALDAMCEAKAVHAD